MNEVKWKGSWWDKLKINQVDTIDDRKQYGKVKRFIWLKTVHSECGEHEPHTPWSPGSPCPTCITGINSICLTGRMNEGFHICWSQSKCFPKIHGACHHCHHIQIYGYLLAWHLATSITQYQTWFVIEISVSMKLSTSSSHESLYSAAAAEHICPKSHAALPVDKFTFCGSSSRSFLHNSPIDSPGLGHSGWYTFNN